MKGKVFAISLAASWTTVLVTSLVAAAQGSLEAADLAFVMPWFAPVALFIAALGAAVSRHSARWWLGARCLFGFAFGAGLGFLWTFFVQMLSWGAVPFAVLVSWTVGGGSGLVAGLVLGPPSPIRPKVVVSLGMLFLAVAAFPPCRAVVEHIAHDQTLAVRFVEWRPGTEPLVIESEHEDDDGCLRHEPLPEDAIALLRRVKPTGRLRGVWGGGVHGRGPRATALVVLSAPVSRRVAVRQPDRGLALYVQTDDGFSLYPPDAKTLGRQITLSPLPDGFWCTVDVAYGGSQGSPVRMHR